jgi:sugar phosphate isomerase/epimerase
VGAGNFQFKRFMSGIKKVGYDGTMTLEIFTDNQKDLIRSREIIDAMI